MLSETTLKRAIQKMAATGDLVKNKIADKVKKSTYKYQIKSSAPA